MLDRMVVFLAYVLGCSPFLRMLAGMTGFVELYRRQVLMLIPRRQPSES